MENLGIQKIEPVPQPPVEGSCCNGGCFPCVWDYYRWALEDAEKLKVKSE